MRMAIAAALLAATAFPLFFFSGIAGAASAYKAPDASPPATTTATPPPANAPATTPSTGSDSAPASGDSGTAPASTDTTPAPAATGSTTAPAATTGTGDTATAPAADTGTAPANGGYQPPSVETAPGGVTIYRGSGTN